MLGLLGPIAGPQAPQAPEAPKPPGAFNSFADFQNHLRKLEGGEQLGGDAGVVEHDRDMMRRGGAPFTANALGAALGNAFGITDPIMATAKMALSRATGMDFGGWQNVPGQFSYDQDLIDSVVNRRVNPATGYAWTRAQADTEQRRRNALKQGVAFAQSMNAVDAARHGGFGGGLLGNGGGGYRDPNNRGGDPFGNAGDRSSPSQAGRAGF